MSFFFFFQLSVYCIPRVGQSRISAKASSWYSSFIDLFIYLYYYHLLCFLYFLFILSLSLSGLVLLLCL